MEMYIDAKEIVSCIQPHESYYKEVNANRIQVRKKPGSTGQRQEGSEPLKTEAMGQVEMYLWGTVSRGKAWPANELDKDRRAPSRNNKS